MAASKRQFAAGEIITSVSDGSGKEPDILLLQMLPVCIRGWKIQTPSNLQRPTILRQLSSRTNPTLMLVEAVEVAVAISLQRQKGTRNQRSDAVSQNTLVSSHPDDQLPERCQLFYSGIDRTGFRLYLLEFAERTHIHPKGWYFQSMHMIYRFFNICRL